MDRTENYLNQVMNNPGKWVLVKKKQGMNSKKAIHNERTSIAINVEQALKLMGIECERLNYKVRVFLRRKEVF